MKYVYVLIVCFLSACNKGSESIIPTTLQVEKTSLEIVSDGGIFSIKVESSDVWTAESNAAWCTVLTSTTVLSGEIKTNNSSDARTAIITIKSNDISRDIPVRQIGTKGQIPTTIKYELFKFLQTEFQYDEQHRLTAIVSHDIVDTLIYQGNELVLERILIKHYSTGEREETSRITYLRSGNTIEMRETYKASSETDVSTITLNSKGLPSTREGINRFGVKYRYTYTYDNTGNLLQSNFFQRTLLMTVTTAAYDNRKGVFSDIQTPKWYHLVNGVPSNIFNNYIKYTESNKLYENVNDEGEVVGGGEPIYQDEIESDGMYVLEYDAHGYPTSIAFKQRQLVYYQKIP